MPKFSVELTRQRIENAVIEVAASNRSTATAMVQGLVDTGAIPESIVVSVGVTPWEVEATAELPERRTHAEDNHKCHERRLWP